MSDNHILSKGTCLGGFGAGNLMSGSTAAGSQVPFHIPNDKALVQISFGDDDGGSAKLNIGTLYSLGKPLEKMQLRMANP